MFGDMMGMMGKLKETQRKVEETKKRLDTVLIDEKSSDNKLKITLTANRKIKSIEIDDALLNNKEQLLVGITSLVLILPAFMIDSSFFPENQSILYFLLDFLYLYKFQLFHIFV